MERQAARGAQADALPAMLRGEAKADAGDAGTGDRGPHAAIADAGYYRVETATPTAAVTNDRYGVGSGLPIMQEVDWLSTALSFAHRFQRRAICTHPCCD